MKKVYDFSSKIIPPISEAGGKARSLIEATKAGLPVPGGIVLTSGFFDEWVKEISKKINKKAVALNLLPMAAQRNTSRKMLRNRL